MKIITIFIIMAHLSLGITMISLFVPWNYYDVIKLIMGFKILTHDVITLPGVVLTVCTTKNGYYHTRNLSQRQ